MSAILGPSFWNRLGQISRSVGLEPEDLLAVMYYESGLDPAAINPHGNATGLIQFEPSTLKGMGYAGKNGEAASDRQLSLEFGQIPIDQQLDYVARYVSGHAKSN